jgi:hypothetical protein
MYNETRDTENPENSETFPQNTQKESNTIGQHGLKERGTPDKFRNSHAESSNLGYLAEQ